MFYLFNSQTLSIPQQFNVYFFMRSVACLSNQISYRVIVDGFRPIIVRHTCHTGKLQGLSCQIQSFSICDIVVVSAAICFAH